MARRKTKREQKRQSIASTIAVGVLIVFAAAMTYFGLSAQNKTKVVIVDEDRNSTENTDSDTVDADTDSRKSVTAKDVQNENTNSEIQEESKKEEADITARGGTDEDISLEPDPTLNKASSYTSSKHGFGVSLPENWSYAEIDSNRIGLFPSNKEPSIQYEGDIVVSVQDNPGNISIKEFYDGSNGVALFDDAAGGTKKINVSGNEVFIFYEVEGYVPSNIAVVSLSEKIIEITDAGMGHSEDGIFEMVVNSIKVQ